MCRGDSVTVIRDPVNLFSDSRNKNNINTPAHTTSIRAAGPLCIEITDFIWAVIGDVSSPGASCYPQCSLIDLGAMYQHHCSSQMWADEGQVCCVSRQSAHLKAGGMLREEHSTRWPSLWQLKCLFHWSWYISNKCFPTLLIAHLILFNICTTNNKTNHFS